MPDSTTVAIINASRRQHRPRVIVYDLAPPNEWKVQAVKDTSRARATR